VAQKVIKDTVKHAYLVSTALYYTELLYHLLSLMNIFYLLITISVILVSDEAADKAKQMQHIYMTKEQHLQGKLAWLFKDPEAWDAMCEWLSSPEFKGISEQNRQRKPSVHHYGADGHVRMTQRQVRYNLSVFSLVFCIYLFVTLNSMLQKKSTGSNLCTTMVRPGQRST
jgi:hypothetical protein